MKIYRTKNETKAAFAERQIGTWKNSSPLHVWLQEKYGYKCIQKQAQFVTALYYRRNCSIEKIEEIRPFAHSVQETTAHIENPNCK